MFDNTNEFIRRVQEEIGASAQTNFIQQHQKGKELQVQLKKLTMHLN
jgi:hypothetical protein